ncbi:MAG: GNAT family N-acetyltransferase [Caldilineaceae bacterium]
MWQRYTLFFHDTPLIIRPLSGGDLVLLQTLHQHVSPDSLYYRYLRPYRPTTAELRHMCQLGEKGAGYVAITEAPTPVAIGVAHYVLVPGQHPLVAEPAFLVQDRFQGQGVGRLLFHAMSKHAQIQGIHAFNAYVHPANGAMLRVFRSSGLPLQTQIEDGVQQVQIVLDANAVQQASFSFN